MTNAMRLEPGAAAPDDHDVSLFSAMLRLRRFEEKAGMLYALGTIACPCPLGIGREAALVALAVAGAKDVILAVATSPIVEIGLGLSPVAAFDRLRSAAVDAAAPDALLREPGMSPVRLARADALARTKSGQQPLIVLLSDSSDFVRLGGDLASPCLFVLMLPADRRPPEWEIPPGFTLRECDGADVEAVLDAVRVARGEVQRSRSQLCLAILTPPYIGHTRSAAKRTAGQRETVDPIALYRERLLQAGRLTEPAASKIETAIRDDIATAARALEMACPP